MTLRDPRWIPILTYHSIDSSGSVISTSPENFRKQMRALAESPCRVMKLGDLAKCIREKRNPPANSLAITFDDGFRNVLDVAFPLMKEYGFSATVFLVTSFCGKNNRWYGQRDQIPVLDLLNWDEIAGMSEVMEFGVHTANHPDLTKIPEAMLDEEIGGARESLEKHTGKSEQAFAYPYGKQSPASRKLVEENFYAGCSTEMNFASLDSDLYFLPRIDMYYFSRNNAFATVGTAAFRRYVRFRSLFRKMREAVTS